MAYNQFTLPKAVADFGLHVATARDLFPRVPPVPVPAGFRRSATVLKPLASTEFGRALYLIGPLLAEVWAAGQDRLALFSGTRFDVDEAAGLVGLCDFVLGLPPQLDYITAPILMVVEAKKEDIPGGLGQCAAELVAGQRFNQSKGSAVGTLYGAVTDGERWRFLQLTGDVLTIEIDTRPLGEMDQIFGILLHVCGIHPAQNPA